MERTNSYGYSLPTPLSRPESVDVSERTDMVLEPRDASLIHRTGLTSYSLLDDMDDLHYLEETRKLTEERHSEFLTNVWLLAFSAPFLVNCTRLMFAWACSRLQIS